jgi:hypothetical protein
MRFLYLGVECRRVLMFVPRGWVFVHASWSHAQRPDNLSSTSDLSACGDAYERLTSQ